MKTYLTYKRNINGLTDVSETAKTVEKIAASSIHVLKREVASLNLHLGKLKMILARLSLFYQPDNHPLLQAPAGGDRALVVLTGDKGLVGGLWHDIVNTCLRHQKDYQSIIAVGTKGARYLEEEGVHPARSFAWQTDRPRPEETEAISRYLFGQFRQARFSQVGVLYPQFITLAKQRPFLVPFLPFEFKLQPEDQLNNLDLEPTGLPIFELSKGKVFNWLLNKYVGLFFHQIVIEAKLSELSARTVAMEHASVKTKQLVQKLTLDYLKERRRRETQKQLASFVVHQIT